MAKRPEFKEFVMTAITRSVVSWKETDAWFALAAYASVLLLPLIVSGLIGEIFGDVVQKILALLATSWLVVLLFVITPYRMWADEKYRNAITEEAGQPRVHIDWRYVAPYAELILINMSSKTIPGIDVMLRNWRYGDDENIMDVLRHLKSNDGKEGPMNLDPLVPTYFRFASLKKTEDGQPVIAVSTGIREEKRIGQDVKLKLGISGTDAAHSVVKLRVKIQNDHSVVIEPWEIGKNAVSPEDGLA